MFQKSKICTAALLALGGAAVLMAPAAFAQSEQRIEVTGSAIKRSVNDEGALPLTVLKADDLRQSGVTSVEQVIQQLSFSQSSSIGSNSIGSGTGGATYANMRGLGTNKTLILLNGRRMSPFAFSVNAVDLNSIPFAVIDRIEVLRDGASAIYGTDAIGGVINFITKSDFNGGNVALEASIPEAKGGGKRRGSFVAGFGDLSKDKYNFWLSVDSQKQDRIRALDRSFSKSGIIPEHGVNGNSATTFPGNFSQSSTGLSGNLSAPNCAPPLSVVSPSSSKTCVFDFSATIDTMPDIEQDTLAARMSAMLPGDHLMSIDFVSTSNRNISRVAPDPVSNIVIAPGNPYYPTNYPGLDTTKSVTVGWRMVPAGPRTNESLSDAARVVWDLRGNLGGWDYVAGLFASNSLASDGAVDGYVNAPFIRSEVAAGRLNPFGDATPAQLAIIQQAKRMGTFATAEGTSSGGDFRVSRELFSMGGGKAALALGAEVRREGYIYNTDDAVVAAIPSAGRSPYHVTGSRDAYAVSAEMLLPVTKQLELTVALRGDHYSDAGDTVNPKVSLKFQPLKQLLLRGSYNTGFKAPTLDDLYGPQSITFAPGAVNDPLLCPNGVVNAAAGGVASRDCGLQVQVQQGGNPNLKPEKSKTFSLGLVVEPVQNMTLSADYWNIKLRDQINAIDQISILGNPTLYGDKIVRCKDIPVAMQAELNRCGADNLNSNAIGYVVTLTDNLGKMQTSGVDLSAGYVLNAGNAGTFNFNWDGTWVRSYKYQNTVTDPLKENVGLYIDNGPVFRWQHAVTLGWARGDLKARLSVRHKTGYTDQNNPTTVVGGPSYYGRVDPYTLVDVSATTKIGKNFSLTAGVTNLFDKDPPFSNQSTRSQRGYDPRFTDPVGRALFLRGTMSF
ncbi:MAG: TonB-dependent receptor [Proteobacteria bacterium]|nr:TonB-dependent receptor [Pseudomonadota bacterium]